jgi:chromosome segregation ATPase
MKNAVILLSILVVVLGGMLYQRNKSAREELDAARKETLAMSNQVTEVTARMTEQALAKITLADTVSNRVAELVGLSNRLVRTAANLEKSQAATAAVQQEVQRLQEKVRSTEAQRDALAPRITELTDSLRSALAELGQVRAEARASAEQRQALEQELNHVRAEKIDLARQFQEPAALQAQLAWLKEREKTRQQPVPEDARPEGAKAKGLKLELQPDGTVKWVKGISDDAGPH